MDLAFCTVVRLFLPEVPSADLVEHVPDAILQDRFFLQLVLVAGVDFRAGKSGKGHPLQILRIVAFEARHAAGEVVVAYVPKPRHMAPFAAYDLLGAPGLGPPRTPRT